MRYNEEKIRNILSEKYDGAFSHIERVIDSCKTEEQLNGVISWTIEYINRTGDYEGAKYNPSEYWFVQGFFREKEVSLTTRKTKKVNEIMR